MMLTAAVYLFCGLAALATLLMIFERGPVKAAMLMLAALLSTAGLYLVLSAQLLAALQIILYAGAIMTLFIVALTVTPAAWRDARRTDKPAKSSLTKALGLAAAAVILTELLKISAALRTAGFSREFLETGTLDLARALFGRFAFQFELLSLIILTSIVAAVALTSRAR
ncbi:MAG: NADH-quinone oxidoreductase subunit J, partial [Elusimicrobiota bacterium]|nr:NADH-quinone oxidoreductase subunit J [Elusimicrobiota bacterium]